MDSPAHTTSCAVFEGGSCNCGTEVYEEYSKKLHVQDVVDDLVTTGIGAVQIKPLPIEEMYNVALEDGKKKTAANYLRKSAQHIEDRASQRDCEDGERSMAKTVEAFNLIYGHNLTETEGWQFMSLLKKVRAVQGNYHEDDYEDDIAYSALAAECEAQHRSGDR